MTEEELKTFDFTSVNIVDLLPQRKPFVMISSLLTCSYQKTVTRFLIQEDNVFVEDGKLVPEGLVENIAQTCAARIGFINKYILHKPVSIGYVCALKDFKVLETLAVGVAVETEINLKGEYGTMLMVDAVIKSDGNMVAEGSMVIALDENRPVNEYKAVVKVSDNIISPLGTTTEENYAAVKVGKSALRLYESSKNLPEPFFASLIDEDSLADEYAGIDSSVRIGEYTGLDGLTRFEKRIILSVSKALNGTGIDPASDDVLFVVSSTKGNVELLDNEAEPCGGDPAERERLGNSAERISGFFANKNTPIVVSNACISGLCAQITAMRRLKAGKFGTVIVTGTDVQSRFIISGFQSFKALSQEACRPFDAQRKGLNLGEAAATIIFKYKTPEPDDWVLLRGAIRNDANHISGPSRTGEGSFRAIKAVLADIKPEELALVSVHGTSTAYNDEMESIALTRAGLQNVPVNSLKGYFGHTMGAAGILETILSMASVDDGTVLGTRGYSESGVSCPLDISSEARNTSKRAFAKLLSGFGGCNAAGIFIKGDLFLEGGER
mgnify:CR=1 FL=1